MNYAVNLGEGGAKVVNTLITTTYLGNQNKSPAGSLFTSQDKPHTTLPLNHSPNPYFPIPNCTKFAQ